MILQPDTNPDIDSFLEPQDSLPDLALSLFDFQPHQEFHRELEELKNILKLDSILEFKNHVVKKIKMIAPAVAVNSLKISQGQYRFEALKTITENQTRVWKYLNTLKAYMTENHVDSKYFLWLRDIIRSMGIHKWYRANSQAA